MPNIEGQKRLNELYDYLIRQRPVGTADPYEMAWYRGTLHGVKIAIQWLDQGYVS